MTDVNYLITQWQATVGVKEISTLSRILEAYSEPHRHYHTLAHLEMCFRVLNQFFPSAHQSVKLALWYHDFVYDLMSERNEELSAERAFQDIQAMHLAWHASPQEPDVDVGTLILATKHSRAEGLSPNGKIVVDVDLAILGETHEAYDAYEAAVRNEYAMIPEEVFWDHRKRILQRFVEREWIYQTPAMRHSDYEARAWQNLNRSLAR